MNTWPALSPGPLGGVWIGWECRKDDVGPWWKCGSSLIQMYVTVGRDRQCLILWRMLMPPIACGQTWLCHPLPVSTVPNTGRNLSKSKYRGLNEEEEVNSWCVLGKLKLSYPLTIHTFTSVLFSISPYKNDVILPTKRFGHDSQSSSDDETDSVGSHDRSLDNLDSKATELVRYIFLTSHEILDFGK